MLLIVWLAVMALAAAAGAWALVSRFPEAYGAGRCRFIRAGLLAAMVLAGLLLLAGLVLIVLIPVFGGR